MLGSEQGKVLHLSSSSWPTAKPEVLYPGDPALAPAISSASTSGLKCNQPLLVTAVRAKENT